MFLTRSDRKISIIGGLLLMGLTLTTGIAVYDVMRQQIESTLGRGLDVALQGKAHLLESQIERGLADTRALAIRPFLVQSIQQLNAQPNSINALRDLERNVNSLTQAGFSAAIVVDKHGNTLAQAGHFSKNQTQALPLNKHIDTLLLWDEQFILRTSKDVLDQEGRRIGSITTENALPQLTRSFGQIRTIGRTGEFILCAPPRERGQKITCFISQPDGVKFKRLSHATKDDEVLPMNYALEGKNGVMAVKDYRQIPVIEAYASLRAIGLGMVLKLDEEELLKPATEKLKIIVLYLAALIIAELLLLNWFVRKLIKSEQEARSAKEKTERFSIELSHKEFELHERLKEITCLYEIRRSIGMELSVDNVCQQIFKYLLPAMQYPENASVMIELDGRQFSSGYRHQGLTHELKSEIKVNHRMRGQLRVIYPEDKPFLLLEEQRLIETIAGDVSSWLERKQIDELLRERLKEITCLYEIRHGMGLDISIDNVCQNIFEHLIPALQFPEIATAVIELEGWRYISGKYNNGFNKPLHSKIKIVDRIRDYRRADRDPACTCLSVIKVNGKVCGQLRVFYPENKPLLIPEEQKLIDAIASDLEGWLERKRLEQALVSVAEEQQHTIGQELHDNLGQQIAAIGYQARALEKKIFATGNEDIATVAASIASQAQVAVVQVKQLAQGLLPFELETNGLIAALQTLASRIATTYTITCEFLHKNGAITNENNLALNLYRIAQEAANNAIRHGGAQHLIISLASEEGMLCLSICDDGCGFSGIDAKHKAMQGMGIKIMQYRAKQLGAKLEFLSCKGGGTEVRLEMRMV